MQSFYHSEMEHVQSFGRYPSKYKFFTCKYRYAISFHGEHGCHLMGGLKMTFGAPPKVPTIAILGSPQSVITASLESQLLNIGCTNTLFLCAKS